MNYTLFSGVLVRPLQRQKWVLLCNSLVTAGEGGGGVIVPCMSVGLNTSAVSEGGEGMRNRYHAWL